MNNQKYKVLALFGKSGAGKDTIKSWLARTQENVNVIIADTTRPPRDYEKDEIDYNFLTLKNFIDNDSKGKYVEVSKFNNWYYGSSIDSLDKNKINIGVFDISRINQLILEDERLDVLPIHIYCQDKTRLLRCLSREKNVDCHEICRRYLADEEDFLDISFSYTTYDNSFDNDDYFGLLNLPEVTQFIKDINN